MFTCRERGMHPIASRVLAAWASRAPPIQIEAKFADVGSSDAAVMRIWTIRLATIKRLDTDSSFSLRSLRALALGTMIRTRSIGWLGWKVWTECGVSLPLLVVPGKRRGAIAEVAVILRRWPPYCGRSAPPV